jgi:hypothetical protein
MDSSYRQSAVNNTVRMFNFLYVVGKLTLVAEVLNRQSCSFRIDSTKLSAIFGKLSALFSKKNGPPKADRLI